jgi:predicted nucleic acid-binding protein
LPRIVLDTDATSLYRKGRLPPPLVDLVRRNGVYVSFVTVGELHKWALLWNWGPARRGLPLVTLNRRDFAGFAEHEGLVLL